MGGGGAREEATTHSSLSRANNRRFSLVVC